MPGDALRPAAVDLRRRHTLRRLLGSAAGGLLVDAVGAAQAQLAPAAPAATAFQRSAFADAWQSLGGVPIHHPAHHPAIRLTAPELAENGAFVAVSVLSELASTEEIAIVVDSNPTPLAAAFSFLPGTEAFIATRIKLAASGHIHAIVRAGGALYGTSCHTTVIAGGCDG